MQGTFRKYYTKMGKTKRKKEEGSWQCSRLRIMEKHATFFYSMSIPTFNQYTPHMQLEKLSFKFPTSTDIMQVEGRTKQWKEFEHNLIIPRAFIKKFTT